MRKKVAEHACGVRVRVAGSSPVRITLLVMRDGIDSRSISYALGLVSGWHQHSGLEYSAGSNSAIVDILVGICLRDVRRCWRGEVSIFFARGDRERHSTRPCHQDSARAKHEEPVPAL